MLYTVTAELKMDFIDWHHFREFDIFADRNTVLKQTFYMIYFATAFLFFLSPTAINMRWSVLCKYL